MTERNEPLPPRPGGTGQIVQRLRAQLPILNDIASVYGTQAANQLLPLITVPYLSRILGPTSWGILAMAQAFALYGSVVVEYGFVYSATRDLARASTENETAEIVAGVTGAKVLLTAAVTLLAFSVYLFIPFFRQHPFLLWIALGSEILKAFCPSFYFYGVNRIRTAAILDISARTAAGLGVFIFIHHPEDVWKFFALQGAGGLAALVVGHAMVYRRCELRWPHPVRGWRMLREGGNMFLFRSAYNIYSVGNAFILGLFVSPQIVGYYSGAEKISGAAMSFLTPVSTALYPRAAGFVKSSLPRAARLTTFSLYAVGALAVILTIIMWYGASPIVLLFLGHKFSPSIRVLQILGLRAILVAWTQVLGFQWLLALGLEKSFQRVTLAALAVNLLLATWFAPRLFAEGMAWAVVISQAAAAAGIYLVLRRRKLNPFAIPSDAAYV